jgi:hypothetical protein
MRRQRRCVRAGPLQDPVSERHDQAGRFGKRNEMVRKDQAAGRMAPADERLDAAEAPGFDVHHRLVMQLELFTGDGIAKLRLRR